MNYAKKTEEIVKVLEENKKLFHDFVSNYSEVTLLGTEIREEIANVIDEAGIDETCYRFFDTEYDTSIIYQFTMDEYYIDDFEISDYSLLLKNDCDEGGDWLPVFFIKEFWEFYNNFMNESENKNKSEKNMNNKTTEIKKEIFSLENIYNIAKHSDKIIHICDELRNIGFNNEEIFEIITNIIKKID